METTILDFPKIFTTFRPTTLPLNQVSEYPQKLFPSKSAEGQFNTSDVAMSKRDPFDEARHNEMKLRPKHYQHIAMNMSRAQLGKLLKIRAIVLSWLVVLDRICKLSSLDYIWTRLQFVVT